MKIIKRLKIKLIIKKYKYLVNKMVNFIQLVGDTLHLISFVIIIYKIYKDKSCKGVSAKTFEIYLIVFCTRYLDLFMYFISIYNTSMKILFIGASAYILYLMHCNKTFHPTYDRKNEDTFPHIYLIPFAIIMTLLIHKNFTLWGLTWSFSLWLESVAVFPQISIIAKTDGVFTYTAHYLAALGSYRFFYILLWIYRYVKQGRVLWVSVFSGILQVLLYVDFFYLYIKNMRKFLSSDLPTVSKKPTNKEKDNIF